ncbi:hypothetical protein bthur0011_35040 [Bacillus thuringiensis serovar huazhongensis BGSC 4BD1]|nr:hypothetical protein bthur0011_35040 [Bacillus thuringiensis serovar huazhongensis BGSC 4BD1]
MNNTGKKINITRPLVFVLPKRTTFPGLIRPIISAITDSIDTNKNKNINAVNK